MDLSVALSQSTSANFSQLTLTFTQWLQRDDCAYAYNLACIITIITSSVILKHYLLLWMKVLLVLNHY